MIWTERIKTAVTLLIKVTQHVTFESLPPPNPLLCKEGAGGGVQKTIGATQSKLIKYRFPLFACLRTRRTIYKQLKRRGRLTRGLFINFDNFIKMEKKKCMYPIAVTSLNILTPVSFV